MGHFADNSKSFGLNNWVGFTLNIKTMIYNNKWYYPKLILMIVISSLITACAPEPFPPIIDNFSRSLPREPAKPDTFQSLSTFQTNTMIDDSNYRLGTGDEITIEVWGHPELSGKHIIGPDGKITLSLVGPFQMTGLSREQSAQAVAEQLKHYYLDLSVTVRVDRYASNRILVLGQVGKPGEVQFGMTAPTLLESIALAGGFANKSGLANELPFTRCAIFRGQHQIVWIELEPLLLGKDLSLNLKLQRNDIVYVPEVEERLVYVLGEVHNPGAFPLTPTMSFIELLAKAGGPTRDAAPGRINVIRPKDHLNKSIALAELVSAKRSINVSLEEGDIIYVPTNTIAKVNYAIQVLNPFSTLLGIYANIESIRADNQYRKITKEQEQLDADRAKLEKEKAQNSGLE